VMGCLIRKTYVPHTIAELFQSSHLFHSDEELLPASRLFNILCRCIEFYVSVAKSKVTNAVETIATAISIDNDLSSWISGLPSVWKYSTVMREVPDTTYGDHYHIYQGSWCACVWNYYRLCRILIHSVMLSTLNTLSSSVSLAHADLEVAYRSQLKKTHILLSQMPSEICASISYQLCLHKTEKRNGGSIPKPSGLFSLLGLLQVLVGSPNISSTSGWVIKTLELMGREFGIRQALGVGKQLKSDGLI